ncbi:hypothetical protein [Kitasatospora sp. NPDC058190]|uniref:hypothetical protein n=1 Tax=Kitasatospora sp. NPDC058190 TaxID=3346371 RepID=UPI0036DD9CCB
MVASVTSVLSLSFAAWMSVAASRSTDASAPASTAAALSWSLPRWSAGFTASASFPVHPEPLTLPTTPLFHSPSIVLSFPAISSQAPAAVPRESTFACVRS